MKHLSNCLISFKKPAKKNLIVLHMKESFNHLFDFSIASKASSAEILLQSQKQMKVTWCEIRTTQQIVWMLPTKSYKMALHCHCWVWSCIGIQHQNTRSKKRPGNFFWIAFLNLGKVLQYCIALMVPTSKSPTTKFLGCSRKLYENWEALYLQRELFWTSFWQVMMDVSTP